MRKKELLAMKKLNITAQMRKKALEDDINSNSVYIRAVVEGEKLKVAMSSRMWTLSNIKPQYEIYISKTEETWSVYDTYEDKWGNAKVDMIRFREGHWGYTARNKNYQTSKDRTLVNEYFETGGNKEIYAAVLGYQIEVRGEELKRKHRRETDVIDEVMNEVPELPTNFRRWVTEKAFRASEYIFYYPQKRKGYCTQCKKIVDIKEAHSHNAIGECGLCRYKVQYKSWGRQKYINDSVKASILQKLEDGSGTVLRMFVIHRQRRRDKGWEWEDITQYEYKRMTYSDNMMPRNRYEWGEYKSSKVMRWCYNINSGYGQYYREESGSYSVPYTANINDIDEKYKRVNAAKLLGADTGEKIHVISVLQKIQRYDFIEYLQKAGLNRMCARVLKSDSCLKDIDMTKKKLKDLLRVDGQQLYRLREIDGGECALVAIRKEKEIGHIKNETLSFIDVFDIKIDDIPIEITKLNINRTINFIKKQYEKTERTVKEIVELYKDYIHMAAELGHDVTQDIIRLNKRFAIYHDRYVEELNEKNMKVGDIRKDNEYRGIKEDAELNEEHFTWSDKEFEIVVPKRAMDIMKEGRALHHCVGGENYLRKMDSRLSWIVFLRRIGELDKSYYTVEVEWNGKIRQAYSEYNKKPNWKKVEKFLKKWTREVKKRNSEIMKEMIS